MTRRMTLEPVVEGEPPLLRSASRAQAHIPIATAASDTALMLLVLMAIITTGWGLRVWHLGEPSLWFDEGVSWDLATRSVGGLLAGLQSADFNPPLYPLLLHFWIPAAGQSEYALRWPSAACSLLTVPLAWSVARRCGAPIPAAIAAAGLASMSIFLTDYAQEARAYTLAAALCLLSAYALLRIVDRRSPLVTWGTTYAVASAAAALSHYAVLLLIPAHLVFIVARQPSRRSLAAAGFLVFGGVLAASWLPSALAQLAVMRSNPDFWPGSISPWLAPEGAIAAIASRPLAFSEQPHVVVAIAGSVFLTAAAALILARGRRLQLLFLVALVALPLLEAALITGYYPKFIDRYLLPIAPLAYVMVAVTVGVLVSRLQWPLVGAWSAGTLTLATVAMVATAGGLVHNLEHLPVGPAEIKDGDMRLAVAEIRSMERPGDAIVLAQDTGAVFRYYYDGSLGPEAQGWFPAVSEFQRGDDLPRLAKVLNQAAAGHQRLWLLLWHPEFADPTGYLRNVVATNSTSVAVPVQPSSLTLRLYQLPPGIVFSPDATPLHPMDVQFGDSITFLGDGLEQWNMPGDVPFVFHLWYRADQPLQRDYRAVLRLVRDGIVWAQSTSRPAEYDYPTNDWRTGIDIPGQLTITAGSSVPPADYHVMLSLYDPTTQRDLPASDAKVGALGTEVDLGAVRVLPPRQVVGSTTAMPLSIHLPVDQGLEIEGLGGVPAEATQGDAITLSMLWRRVPGASHDWVVRILLNGRQGAVAVDRFAPPAPGLPTSQWPLGSAFVQESVLQLPADAPTGQVKLEAELTNDQGGSADLTLDTLDVQPRQRAMQPPPNIPQVASSVFGGAALLAGVGVDTANAHAGGTVAVTLYWHCLQPLPSDYTVFVHLLLPDGTVGAQHDGPPDAGREPTSDWVAGQWITDTHVISLPAGVAAGTYKLEVGMYRTVNNRFERLALPTSVSNAAYPAVVTIR